MKFYHLEIGFPFKFTDIVQLTNSKLGIENIGVSTADVRIQGSSLRTPNAGDIDIAVIVDNNSFNQLLKNNFSERITKNGTAIDIANYSQSELSQLANEIVGNSAYNAQAQTFARALKSGKIRPQDVNGLNSLKKTLKSKYGDIDLSVLIEAGDFDINPYLKVQ